MSVGESNKVTRGERLVSREPRVISNRSSRQDTRLAGLSGPSLAVALVLVSGCLSLMPRAAGQLEAMGAFLSVVPVGPILTTAGVMGVKLAALSRLLQALGYDQAYLANGGAGTAAEPIGLQTKYAYMFPYVPGLNISVKGDHGTEYHNDAAKQREAAEKGGERKTFPAMGLPGDYEHQPRPFRGSDTLKDIFRSAGVNILVPNAQQKIQQQHAKGNGQLPVQGPGPLQPAVIPSGGPNQPVGVPQPMPAPDPIDSAFPTNSDQYRAQANGGAPPSSSSSSSNSALTNPQFNHAPQPPQQQQPPPPPPTQQQPPPLSESSLPQPSSSRFPQPDQSGPPRQQQQPAPQSSQVSNGNQVFNVLRPPKFGGPQDMSASRFAIESNPELFERAPWQIPQHERYYQMLRAQASRVPVVGARPAPMDEPWGDEAEGVPSLQPVSLGHVPPARPHQPPPTLDLPANLATSTLLASDEPPPFNDEFDRDEFHFVHRRRKRDADRTPTVAPAAGGKPVSLGGLIRSAATPNGNGKHQENLSQGGNGGVNHQFGMPAVNIHPFRRRRRHAMN